ncbi:nuclear transport factor 2 family protein [Flavobacterium sp. ZT3R17]|uniref:nuclear transport factor 2 family protein n=1 Tax=Flavobacterium cryoconiti TaxID=3398736 RepID=UPI003A871E89
MKNILTIAFFLLASHVFAQSQTETEILKLSNQIFKWEVENKIDSLENLFDDKFIVVSSNGEFKTKKQYINTLKSGDFIHNRIDVEENTATVINNTATVVGKGSFTVTISGKVVVLHLSYMEVFTRPNPKKLWKIMAMHASVLPN